jgi:hypothetical protein
MKKIDIILRTIVIIMLIAIVALITRNAYLNG